MMILFRSKKAKKDIERQHKLEAEVSLKLPQHNKATDDTIKETKKVTDNFNNIIKENGFTLKIHVAAGGKHR